MKCWLNKLNQHPFAKARELKEFLEFDPGRIRTEAVRAFNLTRARVTQLLKLEEMLCEGVKKQVDHAYL